MSLYSTDLYSQPKRRDYIPLFDDAFLRDEPVEQESVTPEERASVLSEIGALTGGTLSRVGDVLAMPGDYARGLIAGKPGERVTGRDLNRELGLAGTEDNWGNWLAGLGTEVVTDPLAVITGPMKSLTTGGRAAAKLAGPTGSLLETAPVALTRKAIATGMADDALPLVARRTKRALEATGRKISTFDPAVVGRPFYGHRTARRAGTLDDLIKYADNPDDVEAAARNLLGDNLDAIRHQPLSKSFGLSLPFSEPFVVGDALGAGFGDKYADVLDTLGQTYRWSPLGRGMAAGFDAKVNSAIDPESQITEIANWYARKAGGAQATLEHTGLLSRLHAAHPEAFSDEGNLALGRYIEGPAARSAADVAYVESRPALKEYAEQWINNRERMLNESREMGLNGAPLTDKYGIEYLPRRAEAALEMESRRNRKLGEALSAFTSDALRRTDAMQLPGGRTTIMELSQDTMISGSRRTLRSPDEAATYIMQKVNAMLSPGQPPIDIKKARRIARIFSELPDDVVQKSPLFGQHPTEMIGDYMRNKGESLGTARTLYDSLATFAVNQPYNKVEGARHVSLQNALNRLGLKTYDDALDDVFEALPDGTTQSLNQRVGAAQQMRDRLGKMLGVDPDTINLNEFSIPQDHLDRLTRARDLFSSGEAAGSLLKHLDHVTAAWKSSILAWPARAVRDLYSGAVGNWLVGALDPSAVHAAKALVMEGPQSEAFRQTLAAIPRYATDDGLHQFYADLASTGLTSGGSLNDIGSSLRGARALDALVGSDPVTLQSIGSELGQGWNRKDFFTWRSPLTPYAETRNPIMRASEKINSLTDNINRISGFMALLKQGYEPMSAAALIKRVQIDYSDMSALEKNVLKRIFPWYSFQSKIFREVLTQLAERPGGRYGQLIHATESLQDSTDNDTYIPSGLRSQFAMPIPAEFGGVPAPGTQTHATDFDVLGFDQINMLETPGTLAGMAAGTARQIAMQLHPALRVVVEAMVNKDLFTNRPLGESTSAADAILRSVTGNDRADVPFLIEKPLEMLPFAARPLGAARSLLDNRGGQDFAHRAAKTALNATTGIKFRDVSQEDALADAVRQIEESIDPYTREFTQSYIPESLQPNVPQWALRRQAVARALGRERREARKPKKSKKQKSDTGTPQLFE